MKRILILICLLLAMVTVLPAEGAVRGKMVTYAAGGTTLEGYLAWDDAVKGKRPAVLVVHEWWGHNEYARRRARMLAEAGFVALAVDMYGDGKTADHPSDARGFATAVSSNRAVARERFDSALRFLYRQKQVDRRRIAAIGYCFGGGIILNMAREGADLRLVASFHGSLATDTPARKGVVKGRILVFNGEADAMTTPEMVAAFRKEMESAGVDYLYVGYPGVKHSFTNPDADSYAARFGLPLAYDRSADEDSWNRLLRELKKL
ncbi:MAG: dienelactone hydrolase family protein [Desulfuromonadia bacterium]